MKKLQLLWCFPSVSVVKNLPASSGDMGLIPGSRRSPGEGHGNPLLQYSCPENPENPMNSRVWWAVVHGVTESGTTERQTLSTFFTFVIDLENMSLFIVETALQNRLILPGVLDSVYASFHTCFVIFSEPLAILCTCQLNSVGSSHSYSDCKTLVATALFPHSGIVLASSMDELWFPAGFH